MAELTLYIGNKNYSSWSLRAWLVLKHVGTPFKEITIPLSTPDSGAAIRQHSPSGKVPALRYGSLAVWESLAIAEYLAEEFPKANLWPADRAARAMARSIAGEMHSGFSALRTAMPMNLRRDPFKLMPTADVDKDIARIVDIWGEARRRGDKGGPFLFGRFSIADAMFAPVASRFRTYGVALDDVCTAYVNAIYEWPAMREWLDAAKAESWAISEDDRIGT